MTETTVDRSMSAPDRRWVRDLSGYKTTRGVTLDGNLFGALRFPGGALPSGTVVAQVSAPATKLDADGEPVEAVTHLWGPYDPAATDGRQIAERGRVGHLQVEVSVGPGRRVTTSVLDAGGIEVRYLPGSPIGGGIGLLDDDVRAALAGRIRYT
ncbi:hypothetical protein [Kineococcus rubinsiae]|uniref:hypothetical protein n=1 Tax=Kineococcus rubinsiae TaxID=2609562 RepID=UPI001431C3FB|nr:hypothetical protein [Kineococcus rubinsiae]NIZ91566.1 hypothetical protein [Kineococcus rubinsiae]